MSSDPDIAPRPPGLEPTVPHAGLDDPSKARFTRQVLAFLICIGLVALADGIYKAITLGLWQFIVIAVVSAAFVAVVAHAHADTRRGPSGPPIERVFAAIAVTILLVPLWFEQVETMLAAGYIFFILVTAPRLLSLERSRPLGLHRLRHRHPDQRRRAAAAAHPPARRACSTTCPSS
jgi:hypothetical protein